MTIEDAKKKLIALARAQVGYKEGANNYNKYANDPNITKLYGANKQNQPWCCVFVNYCFIAAFGYDIGSKLTYGGTAACAASAELFRKNNAFKFSPEVGDQIFFYSGGGINHTGIVIEVNGSNIKTVEGNYSDGVGIGSYITGSSKIAGYGRPHWDLVKSIETKPNEGAASAGNSPDLNEEDHRLQLPLLRTSNAYNSYCVLLQALLNCRHFACGSADGFYGAKTQAAVSKAQQYFKLEVDGVCGPKTWAKLLEVEK